MNFALQFTEDMDFDEFANDPKTVIAVTKCIEVVGEATKHNIPDSFKTKYQEIPWRDMAGMRDRLVHGYFTVDLEIVWHTEQMSFHRSYAVQLHSQPAGRPHPGIGFHNRMLTVGFIC